MMAFSATSEPKLIAASMMETLKHTSRALIGTTWLVPTFEIQALKGKPPSRANAQHWRDDVAMTVTVEKNVRTTSRLPSMTAYTTFRIEMPEPALRIALISPTQKLFRCSVKGFLSYERCTTDQNEISIEMPKMPLKNVTHIIALGSCSDASRSSSDI